MSSSTCCRPRSGWACARSRGLPSSGRGAAASVAHACRHPLPRGASRARRIGRLSMVRRMTTSPEVTRYVYDFDEQAPGGRELLGGKGIGLAEMTQLGVPVPAGFTITTDACRAFMASGGEVEGLDEEVAEHIARLEQKTGKRFGDPEDPLLVSVRSGAAISMPGMMDTILNLGLADDATAGLARTTGNPRFARDSYRRLIQMYGEVVDGIDGHRFEQAL